MDDRRAVGARDFWQWHFGGRWWWWRGDPARRCGRWPTVKASSFMSRQSQFVSVLDETDRQIRESIYGDQVKHLKEARSVYREEVMDCVRHTVWYCFFVSPLSLFSHWKQRGMYATCMWIVQLLLVLNKVDSIFIYVPEFYLETLVDCIHVLRKSDSPFVPVTIFIKQGLASFLCYNLLLIFHCWVIFSRTVLHYNLYFLSLLNIKIKVILM